MNSPLSIYIHWPFCKAKCPYCDFNSHVRDAVDHGRWRRALLQELAYWAQKLPDRQVASVFFGGGTPSLMEAQTAGELIDAITKYWDMGDDAEITLEANPTSIEAQHFREFRSAGINRVSVGIQAFESEDLRFLGRQHTVKEALTALDVARKTFPRSTFDLIYARPKQTLKAWEAELKTALGFANGHLSLYQLTIEENTAFHTAYHKGAFQMPEEGIAADMYVLTQDIMNAHGLPAYEISNHAQSGQQSRHNLAYWRGDDYIGIGPGAHGRVTLDKQRVSTETIKSPERWLEKVEQSGTGLVTENTLSPREHWEEVVMMGLRLTTGIVYADWQRRTGLSIAEILPPATISILVQEGLVIADEDHIRTTVSGALLLNRVTAELLS